MSRHRHWGQLTFTLPSETAYFSASEKRGSPGMPGLCTGTHFPPTHGLLFVFSCTPQIILEATRMYVNPDRCPACPAVPGGCAHPSRWSQGEGVGGTILLLRRRDPRRHVPSTSQAPHTFPTGGWIRRHVHWGATAARRAERSPLGTCWGTPAPTHPSAHTCIFWLSSLFPFARCLLWCKMLSPNKGVGRAHST